MLTYKERLIVTGQVIADSIVMLKQTHKPYRNTDALCPITSSQIILNGTAEFIIYFLQFHSSQLFDGFSAQGLTSPEISWNQCSS